MSKLFVRWGLVVVPLVVSWPLCPESQHEPAKHEHVPHGDHRPAPTRAIIELVTSASSDLSVHIADEFSVAGISASGVAGRRNEVMRGT